MLENIFGRSTSKRARPSPDASEPEEKSENRISGDLEAIKNFLYDYFRGTVDLVFREVSLFSDVKGLLVYFSGLANDTILNRDVLHTFCMNTQTLDFHAVRRDPSLLRQIVSVANVDIESDLQKAADILLDGTSVLFVDHLAVAVLINSKDYEKRAISEPSNETVIRGPKESFIEDLQTNIMLLRRKIKNHRLVFKSVTLGSQTSTQIAIAYLDGIAREDVINEVNARLEAIDTDAILDAGMIEQFIEDHKFSLFPTIANSEKPDVAAAKLLEGRVGILCGGSPHMMTVPTLFIEYFQTSEDYYNRFYFAQVMRFLRYICFFITTMLPAIYVALQIFHQEMIPTVLLVKMSGAMSGIPFPTIIEALLMIFFYEVLREAGTRLPRVIGPAISIVGALIVGEASVNAGLVSSTIVIVVALSAICSFALPGLLEPIIILRVAFVFAGGFLGLFGVVCGVYLVIIHLCSLQSFGMEYTSPFATFNVRNLRDSLLRYPLGMLKTRPAGIVGRNKTRQK
ncbi:spore germination protein [Oscillospiraceae bacterium CM]|nr:spore germination protein [Oscillospiraceae bacterium CM]